MNHADNVERPHVFWWIAVLGGLTILALQGMNEPFYGWWTARVNALPAQKYLVAIFLACIPIHAAEAVYCFRLAHRLGMHGSATGWAVQTFFLGFPSTWLLMKRRPGRTALRGSPAS